MKRIFIKLAEWLFFIVTAIIVILAIFLSIARALLPHAPEYQKQMEIWASHAIRKPVRVGEVEAGWRGLRPELKFKNVELLNDTQTKTLIHVDELDVDIDWLESLFKWKVEPGLVIVSGANLTVSKNNQGIIIINGVSSSQEAGNGNAQEIIAWLLSLEKIYLQDVNLVWRDRQGNELTFKNIKFALVNNLLSHQLIGEATLEQTIPTHFHFVLNIKGDLIARKNITAKFYLYGRDFVLNQWAKKYSFAGLKLNSGHVNFQLWANINQNQLQTLQSKFVGKNIGIQPLASSRNVIFKELSGNVLWQRESHGWGLAGNQIKMVMNGQKWPENEFALHVIPQTAGQPAYHSFQVKYLDISRVRNFFSTANLLSPQEQQFLSALSPRGELQNFSVKHYGDIHNFSQIDIVTEFNNLSWQRWKKVPLVDNLSGVIHFMPTGGQAVLQSSWMDVDFGSLFRKVLPMDMLNAQIGWRKTNGGWHILAKNIVAQNDLANIKGDMSLMIPSANKGIKPSPVINLLASFHMVDFPKVLQYFPVGIVPKGVVSWLDQAIVNGKDAEGQIVLRGPLKRFPFDKNEGQFIVDSQLSDVGLHYYDKWPPISELNAEIIFADDAMYAAVNSGKVLNAKIINAQVVIADLRKAVLTVNGRVEGDLQDGVNFLQQSPLNSTIGNQLEGFNFMGPMSLGLQLTVPIKATQNITVQGNASFHDGHLQIPEWWNMTVSNLKGILNFTENDLNGNVTGKWNNQPLQISITTLHPKNKPAVTQIDLGSGQLSIAQLQQQFGMPKINYVTGASQYHAMLHLQSGKTPVNTLNISSNLQGISVQLPAPLGKQTNAAVPFNLTVGFGSGKVFNIFAKYGSIASAALIYHKKNGALSFHSGDIELGSGQAVLQSQPGLLISGKLDNFSWPQWQPIFAPYLSPSKTPGVKAPKSILRAVDMTFGQLALDGRKFSQIHLQLTPSPQTWDVQIDSPTIAGDLTVPNTFPKGQLVGDFDRLYLSGADKKSVSLAPVDVPPMRMTIRDFRYIDKNFGNVNLNLQPEIGGMRINRLDIGSNIFQLSSSGYWHGLKTSQTTSLTGELTTKNIGSVLKQLGITASIAGGNGNARFNLQWQDAPYAPSLKSLSGNLSLQFHEGRIINLSKAAETELGLGRVLNLFSLQTLPRRLTLDFSDLTDEGFSFDIMKGDFTLRQGSAFTQNAFLDGPVAKVTIKGRIGLAQQDYDLFLTVTPYLTSSLPVVATVAGGPIAGAVTWIAGKLLSPAVSAITTYTYKVTGSWNNPNVAKVSAPRSN